MAQLATQSKNSFLDINGKIFAYVGGVGGESYAEAKRRATASSQNILSQSGITIQSGRFVSSTGEDLGTDLDFALQSGKGATQLAEARGGFEQLLSQFRGEIESAGAEQEDLATSQSARRFGTLANQVRSTLLSQGRDPQQIEAILAGGQEQQERNLGDLLSQISSGTQERLAGATQLELGTNLNLEGIQTQRQGLQNALFQFLSSQSQQQSQFDQTMAMQPTGFEQILGQLAGGIGQGVGMGVGMYAGSKFG